MKKQLTDGLEQLGITLSEAAVDKLLAYIALLEKWNKVYNLTAIREPERMVSHHVLDSLSALPHLPDRALHLLDVGSGGGMPGILFAITRPAWKVVLLDSNHKKTSFLRQAVIDLGLSNVEVVTDRVEAYTPAVKFDVITSRAFAELATFVSLTQHLLADYGQYAALKGVYPFEEIENLPEGFTVEEVLPLEVPGLSAERHLVKLKAI